MVTIRCPLWEYAKHATFSLEFDSFTKKIQIGYRANKHSFLTEIEKCEILDPAIAELPPLLSN